MRQAKLFDKSWKDEGLKAGYWDVIHFEDAYYDLH
jgi:hypothetical protein